MTSETNTAGEAVKVMCKGEGTKVEPQLRLVKYWIGPGPRDFKRVPAGLRVYRCRTCGMGCIVPIGGPPVIPPHEKTSWGAVSYAMVMAETILDYQRRTGRTTDPDKEWRKYKRVRAKSGKDKQ